MLFGEWSRFFLRAVVDFDRKSFENALKRLQAISFIDRADRAASHVALMYEFLRRSAIWDRHLGGAGWPFFDVTLTVIGTHYGQDERFTGAVAALKQDRYLAAMKSLIFRAYLEWDAFKQNFDDSSVLPAPYEPLIVLFERGGDFWREHIFVFVGDAGIPATAAEEFIARPPLPSLADDYLDLLDLQGAAE